MMWCCDDDDDDDDDATVKGKFKIPLDALASKRNW